MQELGLTPSTVILLLVIVACAVLAVRRILTRGMCDCGDDRKSEGCAHCGKRCKSGQKCTAAAEMVAKMERHQAH